MGCEIFVILIQREIVNEFRRRLETVKQIRFQQL